MRRCRELISCMQALLCDANVPEDAASVPHAVTHAPEALRYGLMSRHGRAQGEAAERVAEPFRFAAARSIWDA